MDQGEEAGTESLKEDPLDFALWKGRKEDEDTGWDVALGGGEARAGTSSARRWPRRSWASSSRSTAAASTCVFPHHENEIAQSEAARGKALARIWMHNGMVELDEEKMSKSVGNIFQLSEALDRFGRDAVVAFLASGHYRQPLAFSDERSNEPAARVERIRNSSRRGTPDAGDAGRLRSSEQTGRRSSTPSPTTSTRRAPSRRFSS